MTTTKIYLDFETYYDVQLSLSKMSTVQYINHPDFKVWGVGIKVESEYNKIMQACESSCSKYGSDGKKTVIL